MRRFLQLRAFGILAVAAALGGRHPLAGQAPSSSQDKSAVREFLLSWVRASPPSGQDSDTRFIAAFANLGGSRLPEAVIYLRGRAWCGSGGCTLLILRRSGRTWKVITPVTIVQPPVRVLESTSNGWRDLAVQVRGGGIQPGYEALLPFDGRSYPRNPSVPPARPLTSEVPGSVLIGPSQQGERLFPP
jgi:hypothetical protein